MKVCEYQGIISKVAWLPCRVLGQFHQHTNICIARAPVGTHDCLRQFNHALQLQGSLIVNIMFV